MGNLESPPNGFILGKPITSGRTAEIYPWHEDHILKLFYPTFSEAHAQHEAQIAAAVHAAGLPVPAVGKILQVEGRFGLVYEYVQGISMLQAIRIKPWTLLKHARTLAELQVELHKIRGLPGLPTQHERLARKIRAASGLLPDLQNQTLDALAKLTPGDHLCHGDFHPDNLILTPTSPVIIDWNDATLGSSLADLARTSILIQGEAASSSLLISLGLRAALRAYLKRYFALRPGGESDYQAWLPVVAAARMSEGIPELIPWLREQVEHGLERSNMA